VRLVTNPNASLSLSYILNHLGEERGQYRNAVSPPIYQTSNFAMPNIATMREMLRDELGNSFYTRGNNPTVEILRKKIAALEGAEDALLLGSGAAAMAIGVMGLVRAGQHVICVQKPYSWTRTLLSQLLPRFGVRCSFVDGTRVENFAQAMTSDTALIVLESPNSMTFELQDLAAVATLAKAHAIRTMVDNSYASPLFQKPLALGIDLVAHSATKYLNGHSDVLAGALCGTSALIREIFSGPFMTLGPLLSPHDAWLVLRGLRTLPLRLLQIGASTEKVVDFLRTHARVRKVYFVHSDDFPQAELAAQQMGRFGGLVSIELAAHDIAAVDRFVDALKLFLIAASWGGYESLIMPVAGFVDPAQAEQGGAPNYRLLRLSIGLEPAEELIADLAQALAVM
jgi:cystathionine beta-lyase/cystathionine gamma-synthase